MSTPPSKIKQDRLMKLGDHISDFRLALFPGGKPPVVTHRREEGVDAHPAMSHSLIPRRR